MRVSIVSILLAGGALALGACSTSVESRDITLAEQTSRCNDRAISAEVVPAGRETGSARNDYQCQSVHVAPDRSARTNHARQERARAVDRALSGAYPRH